MFPSPSDKHAPTGAAHPPAEAHQGLEHRQNPRTGPSTNSKAFPRWWPPDFNLILCPQERAPEESEGLWGRVEGYLYSHGLRLDMPRELAEGAPGKVLEALPRSITVPLAQGEVQEGEATFFLVIGDSSTTW